MRNEAAKVKFSQVSVCPQGGSAPEGGLLGGVSAPGGSGPRGVSAPGGSGPGGVPGPRGGWYPSMH